MSYTNYVLADPLSVATQGLLDEDIGISLLGWIIRRSPSKPDVSVPLVPLLDNPREWWVRKYYFEDPVGSYELEGPYEYTHADQKARDISSENDSGLTELVTYEKDKMYLVFTYLRGKKRYQGIRTFQASEYNLPPTL